MLYYLGCLLWFQLPYNSHTNINLMSSGTHSVVYTYKTRQALLAKKGTLVFDWDIYNNFFSGIRRYVYHKPLCYQLFEETENSKNWPSFFGFDPVKLYIKYKNLDVQVEDGYSNTYTFSKVIGYLSIILFLIFFLVCIFIISYLSKKMYSKINLKKVKIKK